MSEQEVGGAAAFIANVEKDVGQRLFDANVRQRSQIDRMLTVLREIMEEEKPFVAADGVEAANVAFGALGCAMGAGSAALGELFRAHKPDDNPYELMATVQHLVGVFSSRAQ